MSKISDFQILTELNEETFVPVIDLTESDKANQNKRASPEVFKGPKGDTGEQGTPGANGADGADGQSAYELWVAQPGNEGKTE